MAAVVGNASGDAQSSAPGYADALQRAREIAAKIQPDTPGPMGDYSQKRPLEDAEEPGAKKLASQNDSIGSQLGNMQNQISGGRPTITESFRLPDKLVGLVIGKGGDNITRMQEKSGCRIQISQDCQGGEDRPCTLTGTPEEIGQCREMLQETISKAAGGMGVGMPPGLDEPLMGAQTVIQLMIPPDKCGLIIGKGGETIKAIQQNIGVKMMLIQDTTQNTGMDKPLRISGEPMKVEQAKQHIEQIMAQRDLQQQQQQMQRAGAGGGGGRMNFPSGPQKLIPVPKPAVGVVIGKGGDMITRIQNETGTRVQFKQEEEDPNIPHRMCTITGPHENIQKAIGKIQELIQSVRDHDNPGMGGQGQRGRNRPGGSFGQWEGPGGMARGRSGPGINTVEFNVPTNKTGLVIGKGGENIRQINQQSQAHVEIQRNPPPGSDQMYKTFIIKGTPEQIALAQQLIQEKVDGGPSGGSNHGHGGPSHGGGHGGLGIMGHGPPGTHHGPPGGPGGFGPPPPQNNFGAPPPGPGFGGPPQGPPQQTQPPQQFQNQQQWAGAPNQYQWPQPGGPQQNGAIPQDPNKPPDSNAAAWANYYNYYQNQGQQPAAAAAAVAAAYPQQTAAAPGTVVPAQTAAGQPDYTKAWEEYYKKQAEAAAPAVNPAATSQTGGADYSAAWAEYYRQYAQYYQQSQAQQQYSAAPAAPAQQ